MGTMHPGRRTAHDWLFRRAPSSPRRPAAAAGDGDTARSGPRAPRAPARPSRSAPSTRCPASMRPSSASGRTGGGGSSPVDYLTVRFTVKTQRGRRRSTLVE